MNKAATSLSASGSESIVAILADRPTNFDILNILNNRLIEVERVITFNGNIMEDMKETVNLLKEEKQA